MIQRPSSAAPNGSATHKNHGAPLVPLTSQITNKTRLIVSQDPHAARQAGEHRPCLGRIDPRRCRSPGGGLAAFVELLNG